MIAPFSPLSDLITVASIEARLHAEKCTKVSEGAKHTCLWKAPNGRSFHAPNPNVYKLVPPDMLESVLKRMSLVSQLPAPPSASTS